MLRGNIAYWQHCSKWQEAAPTAAAVARKMSANVAAAFCSAAFIVCATQCCNTYAPYYYILMINSNDMRHENEMAINKIGHFSLFRHFVRLLLLLLCFCGATGSVPHTGPS